MWKPDAYDESVLVEQLEALTRRMESTREPVGETTWCNTSLNGFSRLAEGIERALACVANAESELTWLRSWLLWFGLRQGEQAGATWTLNTSFCELLLIAESMSVPTSKHRRGSFVSAGSEAVMRRASRFRWTLRMIFGILSSVCRD